MDEYLGEIGLSAVDSLVMLGMWLGSSHDNAIT